MAAKLTRRTHKIAIQLHLVAESCTICSSRLGIMAAKLTRLTHKLAIQLQLVAESCTICSSRSRRPVRKLLDTPSYLIRGYMFSAVDTES
jgi:hypothetical protein